MKKSKHSIGTIVGNIVGGLILTGLSVIAQYSTKTYLICRVLTRILIKDNTDEVFRIRDSRNVTR